MQAVTSPAYSLPATFTVYVAPSETPPTQSVSNDYFSLPDQGDLEKLLT
jgi:hypothetical protein